MILLGDFLEIRGWPAVLHERKLIPSGPAVYALLHEHAFGRLKGESRILYIGSTGMLGGDSDSCRLRIYRYPNGQHARELRRRTELLIASGAAVTFQWKDVATKDEATLLESVLLERYAEEHWELPPFNGRN
jgi:hypothetical protein